MTVPHSGVNARNPQGTRRESEPVALSENTLTTPQTDSKQVLPTAAPAGPWWGDCACVQPADQVRERLGELSRRGKLPGFGQSKVAGEVCEFAAFGDPLDYAIGVVPESGRLRFRARMKRRTPLVFAVVGAVSVWPGSWLTDSMLRSYFESYDWNTYAWYIPLTVLPLPWMFLRMQRRSRASAYEHFREKLELIRAAVAGGR
jgi:hypothetical protein